MANRRTLVVVTALAVGLATLDKVERQIAEETFRRTLVAVAIRLVDIGAFDAGRAAIEAAAKQFGLKWRETRQFLLEFAERRQELRNAVARLLHSRFNTQAGAREWAILLLGTFRRYKPAFYAMKASGNRTLEGARHAGADWRRA